MADPEQVERLKRSVSEWNTWRRDHPDIRPDLNGTDISGIDISRINISETNLNHANLAHVCLSHADLSHADLSHADLSHADLSHANLVYTNLSSVNLRNTNLTKAVLIGANLSSTNLTKASLCEAYLSFASLGEAYFRETDLTATVLTNARFDYTTFVEVDLSSVKGLETTTHDGPSTININSVILPYDRHVRLHFLRGIGFAETQIEYLPSLLTPCPIQYYSLFISYAHQDEALAKRLHSDLRNNDVPCWFAPHDLRPGIPIVRGIEEAIHSHEKLLVILSHHAVNSYWVQQEVESALYKEVTTGQEMLFPIRLDNTVLESESLWATRLQQRHIADFTNWQDDTAYQQALTTLLRHLKVNRPPPL